MVHRTMYYDRDIQQGFCTVTSFEDTLLRTNAEADMVRDGSLCSRIFSGRPCWPRDCSSVHNVGLRSKSVLFRDGPFTLCTTGDIMWPFPAYHTPQTNIPMTHAGGDLPTAPAR